MSQKKKIKLTEEGKKTLEFMKKLHERKFSTRVFKNEQEKEISFQRMKRYEKMIEESLLEEALKERRKKMKQKKKQKKEREKNDLKEKKITKIMKKGLNKLIEKKNRKKIQKKTREEKRGQNQLNQLIKKYKNKERHIFYKKEEEEIINQQIRIQLISLLKKQDQNKKKREKGKNKYKIKMEDTQDKESQTKHFQIIEQDYQNYFNDIQQLLANIQIKTDYIITSLPGNEKELLLRRNIRMKQGRLKTLIETKIREDIEKIEKKLHGEGGMMNKMKRILNKFKEDKENRTFNTLAQMKKQLRIGNGIFYFKNRMQNIKAEMDMIETEVAILSLEKFKI